MTTAWPEVKEEHEVTYDEEIDVGFSGARLGMTLEQQSKFAALLIERCYGETGFVKVIRFHHGMCEGADEQAEEIARKSVAGIRVIGWPGLDDKGLAKHRSEKCKPDEIRPARPFLERNHVIARMDVVFTTPYESNTTLRSGTWSTIRRARNEGTELYIIYPDGRVHYEEET